MKIICDCGAEAEFFENKTAENFDNETPAVLIENEITMWHGYENVVGIDCLKCGKEIWFSL